MPNAVAELLERQLDEIEVTVSARTAGYNLSAGARCSVRFCEQALVATFPEEGAVHFTAAEQAALDTSKQWLSAQASQIYTPQLSGSVSFLSLQLEGSPIGLHFTLPHDYPDAAPRIQVQCAAGRYTQGVGVSNTCNDERHTPQHHASTILIVHVRRHYLQAQ